MIWWLKRRWSLSYMQCRLSNIYLPDILFFLFAPREHLLSHSIWYDISFFYVLFSVPCLLPLFSFSLPLSLYLFLAHVVFSETFWLNLDKLNFSCSIYTWLCAWMSTKFCLSHEHSICVPSQKCFIFIYSFLCVPFWPECICGSLIVMWRQQRCRWKMKESDLSSRTAERKRVRAVVLSFKCCGYRCMIMEYLRQNEMSIM